MSSKISSTALPLVESHHGHEPISFNPFAKVRRVAQQALLSDAFFARSSGGLTAAYFAVEMAKMPLGVDRVLDAIHAYFHQNGPSILETIRSFSSDIDHITAPLERICEELTDMVTKDPEGYRKKRELLQLLLPVIRRLILISKTSHTQLLRMTAMGFDQASQGFQDLLSVITFARLKDMELLQTQITLLQAQENFELAIAIELYSLQIEEEAKKFDQLLQVIQVLDEEEEEKKLEQSRLEKQAKKEKTALRQLDEERQKAVDQHLQQMQGLVVEHKGLTHKIDSNRRQQILDALQERVPSKK
jgi:hypothetical protein